MKKAASIASFVAGIPVFLITAVSVYAQQPGAGAGQEICSVAGANFSALCKLRIESNSGGIVGTIVGALIIIAIIVALFFLILGGINYTTSGGDRAKTDQARSRIIAALVGLVIALAAYGILQVVFFFITGQDFKTLAIPRLID